MAYSITAINSEKFKSLKNCKVMHNKLSIKIARIITFAAVLFAICASLFSYFHTQSAEVKASRIKLEQLFLTAKGSASIAADTSNKKLAKEVVDSLAKNDIVACASIINFAGMAVESDQHANPMTAAIIFKIYDPLVTTEQVGELQIQPDNTWIEKRTQAAALENILILVIHTLLIVMLLLWLVQHIFTQPILSIAKGLHTIIPGDGQQLACPIGHKKDEIGNLVNDINKLLSATQKTIEQERVLRGQIENLEKHFRLIFERASAGIFLLDHTLHITSANTAFTKLFDSELNERRANKQNAYLPSLFHDPRVVQELLHDVLSNGKQSAHDLKLSSTFSNREEQWLHCLFSTVENDQGETLIEGLVIDITERTSKMEQILFDSEHDPLTKLLNRRAGKRLLGTLLTRAESAGNELALLLVDLDGFKQVNDHYGHKAGDHVLVEASNRMQAAIRKEDVLFRLGGDEFIIAFILSKRNQDEVNYVVDKVLSIFDQAFDINENTSLTLGASIGITLFPTEGDNVESLIAKADSDMYQMKKKNKILISDAS